MADQADPTVVPQAPAPPVNDEQAWQMAGQTAPQPEQPAPAAPAPAPEPASTALRDAFATKYDPSAAQQFQSDDELLDALHAMYQRGQQAPDPQTLQQFQQAQPLLVEYTQNAPAFKEWQAQQAAQQQPAEPEAPKWQAPQLSQLAKRMVDQGIVDRTNSGRLGIYDQVTGEFVENPMYAAELREIEAYLDHSKQFSRQLSSDPVGTILEAGLEDRIKGMLPNLDELKDQWKQEFLAEVHRIAGEGQIANTIEQQSDLFFAKDENGQLRVQVNRQTGRPEYVLSTLGQAYREQQQVAIKQFGVDPNDVQRLHAFAMNSLKPYIEHAQGNGQNGQQDPPDPTPAPAPATPQQKRQSKQESFLAGARSNGQPVNRLDQPAPATVADAAGREREIRTDEQAWNFAGELMEHAS